MQIGKKLPLILDTKIFYYLLGGLLVVIYAPLLYHWIDGWLNKSIGIEHEYFSHGLIGFPFAAYIIWQDRKKWQRSDDSCHPLGGILLGLATVFFLSGSDELMNLSFPLVLLGVCLWLKGMAGFRLYWFPWLLVLLATPNSIPYLITPYTLPLQKLIAGCAGFLLMQMGFDVEVQGIYVTLGGRLVEVAPYCAGLKMLFTSLYVSLMLLYWTDNIGDRRKVINLLVGAVFISVIGNIFRNTILAFFHGTGQESLFVWLHDSWGGDLYSALMLGVIVLLMKALDRFNYEPEIESVLEGSNASPEIAPISEEELGRD
jgi:cyanoexosortase B